jgi:hypothetical protein
MSSTIEGINRADAAANETWKDAALQAVRRVCEKQATFFSDDVWREFIAACGEFARTGTHNRAAMGPVLLRAARLGWCKRTDEYRRTEFRAASNHNNVALVWRSLL